MKAVVRGRAMRRRVEHGDASKESDHGCPIMRRTKGKRVTPRGKEDEEVAGGRKDAEGNERTGRRGDRE